MPKPDDSAPLPPKERVMALLREAWRPVPASEEVDVEAALGRIPARDHLSVRSIPVVRSASMDGWAVRSADFAGPVPPDASGWLAGRDYARADMGDDFPDAFDAVVLVEEVDSSGPYPVFLAPDKVVPGLNVRRAGSQIAEGDLLVKAGRPLLPKDLAMLQMGGLDRVEALRRPVVAFIPSGAELVAPGTVPERGQNIDTNSLLVAATLAAHGAEVRRLPVVPDDPAALAEAVDSALAHADVAILCGGSSKGGEDHAGAILRARGRVVATGVAAAPGKPLGLYVTGEGRLLVNLPGPMIAAYYCLEWCLKPAVDHFLGRPTVPRPVVRATLAAPMDAPEGLSFLFNLRLEPDGSGGWLATPLDPRSVRTTEGISANAQHMSDPGRGRLEAGEAIRAEVLRPEEILAGRAVPVEARPGARPAAAAPDDSVLEAGRRLRQDDRKGVDMSDYPDKEYPLAESDLKVFHELAKATSRHDVCKVLEPFLYPGWVLMADNFVYADIAAGLPKTLPLTRRFCNVLAACRHAARTWAAEPDPAKWRAGLFGLSFKSNESNPGVFPEPIEEEIILNDDGLDFIERDISAIQEAFRNLDEFAPELGL